MKKFHIVGRKNHGKTSLVLDLIREFQYRGLRVGTIKHTHHRHEIDVPGKDSHQHRLAGASPVAIVSDGLQAIFRTVASSSDASHYECLKPYFSNCDLVLVEGHAETPGVKLEVWRTDLNEQPLALTHPSIAAIVTDARLPHDLERQVFPRQNVAEIATWISLRLGHHSDSST